MFGVNLLNPQLRTSLLYLFIRQILIVFLLSLLLLLSFAVLNLYLLHCILPSLSPSFFKTSFDVVIVPSFQFLCSVWRYTGVRIEDNCSST